MDELLKVLNGCCPMVDFETGRQLWSNKIIDSMDMVAMISALENRYGINIEYDMITPDNFDSADAILAMVERLSSGEQ